MTKPRITRSLLKRLAVLAAVATGLLAATGAAVCADPPPREVALTEQQIFRYIQSLASPAVADVNTAVDRLMGEAANATDPKVQEEFQSKLERAQDDFARAVGFATYREYADVGHTYSRLYVNQAMRPPASAGGLSDIDKAIAEIEATTAMSAAEKKDLIDSMRAVAAKINQQLLPENVDLYRRLKPRIDLAVAEVERILASRAVGSPPSSGAK